MAVRSQEMRSTTVRSSMVRSNNTVNRPRTVSLTPSISLHSFAYIVTVVLALLAVYAVMGNIVAWGQVKIDDLRYGNPRTFHLDAVVGHNDGNGTPTHLVAMNMNRQVIILEMPGGDASKIRTLVGPYLFGANEDKTPILMRLEDLNQDGSQDLIVSIKNEEIVYLNRDGEFKLMTVEERQQIGAAH